jgi:hypothetical protein
MKNGKRDYKRELAWEKENGKGRQNDRVKRNAARRMMEEEGKVKKGDGKHVDHKNNNQSDNSKKNLRVVSAKTNLTKEAKRKARKAY